MCQDFRDIEGIRYSKIDETADEDLCGACFDKLGEEEKKQYTAIKQPMEQGGASLAKESAPEAAAGAKRGRGRPVGTTVAKGAAAKGEGGSKKMGVGGKTEGGKSRAGADSSRVSRTEFNRQVEKNSKLADGVAPPAPRRPVTLPHALQHPK
jgi:DNA replication initiation complex subunit (GINS family)